MSLPVDPPGNLRRTIRQPNYGPIISSNHARSRALTLFHALDNLLKPRFCVVVRCRCWPCCMLCAEAAAEDCCAEMLAPHGTLNPTGFWTRRRRHGEKTHLRLFKSMAAHPWAQPKNLQKFWESWKSGIPTNLWLLLCQQSAGALTSICRATRYIVISVRHTNPYFVGVVTPKKRALLPCC